MTSVRILWVTLLSIWLTRPDQIAATTGMTEIAIRITVTAIATITTTTTTTIATTVIGHRTTGALLTRVLESWVLSLEIVQSQTCLPILCKFQVCCGKLPFINHKFRVLFFLLLFYFFEITEFCILLKCNFICFLHSFLPTSCVGSNSTSFSYVWDVLLFCSPFSLTFWWSVSHSLKGKSFGI